MLLALRTVLAVGQLVVACFLVRGFVVVLRRLPQVRPRRDPGKRLCSLLRLGFVFVWSGVAPVE